MNKRTFKKYCLDSNSKDELIIELEECYEKLDRIEEVLLKITDYRSLHLFMDDPYLDEIRKTIIE